MTKRNWLLLICVASGVAQAQAPASGDAAAGKAKAAVCAACHGADGNSSNPTWPKLAGQHPSYLFAQLKAFKSGDRKNPIMAAQVANLSEEDMRNLAAHFAAQTMTPGADDSADPALTEAGKSLFHDGDPEAGVTACVTCHGPEGRGDAEAGYPRIGGQHAQYLAAQLKAFRSGTRGNTANGQIMAAVADKLSDEDIKAVTAYVSSLP